MGNEHSNINHTLIGWWYSLKHKETLMFGPQMAFNLRSPTGKTILIFGENHKSENIPPCGNDQKTFTELYSELLNRETCEKMQVVLELSVWKRQEALNIAQTNKIIDLLKNYYKIYKDKESCNIVPASGGLSDITLQFSNPDKSNTKILRYIKNLEDMINNNLSMRELQKSYFLEELYDDIQTSFFTFEKNINNTLKTFPSNDKEIIKKLTDKLTDEMNENLDKLKNIRTNEIQELLEIVYKCYIITLRTIDVYAILSIIGNNMDSIVYMGVLHSAYVASFLVSKCGYHLMDIGSTVSDYCIQFDDDAFENKYIKLKRFIMEKEESQKSYLLEIFKDIEIMFTKVSTNLLT